MTKKISFFVVTVAAVALVLSGCGRGPGMDDMEPDDMATVLPYVGTWYLADLPDDATVPPGEAVGSSRSRLAMGRRRYRDGSAFETPITMIVVTGDFEP